MAESTQKRSPRAAAGLAGAGSRIGPARAPQASPAARGWLAGLPTSCPSLRAESSRDACARQSAARGRSARWPGARAGWRSLALAALLALAPAGFAQTVSNTATVTPPEGVADPNCNVAAPTCNSATDTDTVVYARLQNEKSGTLDMSVVAPADVANPGDAIDYTITVANTGDGAALGVSVSDPRIATLACQLDGAAVALPVDVPAGGRLVCTGRYTLVQQDIDNGQVDNTATITGSNVCGAPGCTVEAQTPIQQASGLGLEKRIASGSPYDSVGDVVAYEYVVTNTGNTTLTEAIQVSDDKIANVSCPALPSGGLAPSQSITCTASYTIGQADLDAGQVVNTATAASGTLQSPQATATAEAARRAGLTLEKTASPTTVAIAGETVSYSFVVTNTGNLTLRELRVDETAFSGTGTPPSVSCPASELAPGTDMTCTASYVVTQADIDAGSVTNTATATGTPPPPPGGGAEPITSLPDNAAVTVVPNDLVAGEDSSSTPQNTPVTIPVLGNDRLNGEPATPGNVTITGTSPPANGTVTVNPDGTITYTPAPGFSGSDSFTYTICENDNPSNCTTAVVTVTVEPNQVSAADDSNTTSPGVPVGNDVLDNDSSTGAPLDPSSVSVVQPPANGTVSCDANGHCIYTPNEGFSGTDSYTYQVCDTSTPTRVCDTAVVTITVTAPSLSLEKIAGEPVDANGNGITDAGDTIEYRFVARNTGDVELQDVSVDDPKLSAAPIACAPSTVPVGGSAQCGPLTYTITAADVDAGRVDNSATASGAPAGGRRVSSAAATTSTPTTTPAPGLSSSKAQTGNDDADGSGDVSLGDRLTYVVTATNTGNVPLLEVEVRDDRLDPASIVCARVEPGAACVLTGTYVVVQADVDAGRIVNTAQIATAPPAGGSLPPEACPAGSADPDCAPTATTPVAQRPALAVSKTAELTSDRLTPGVGNSGDVITYTVTVTNTGNVTLNELEVIDTLQGGDPVALRCAPAILAPGAQAACEVYSHTITSAEASGGGTLDNSVAATGRVGGASGSATASASAVAAVAVEPDPTEVRITKTAQPRDVKIGDLVRYTLVLENVGEAAVADAVLVDTPPAGFTLVEGSLSVEDDDKTGRLIGTSPISVDQIDIAIGQRARITYLLRVGAGVRAGVHTNRAQLSDNGERVSNLASADVRLVADPLMDESLILGTVFDDRDSDGWQDSAALDGVRVQGGFAPGAYVAGSTTLDRGDGPKPLADASAPLLHGVELGRIAGRASDADPTGAHRVVLSQTLRTLEFSDDFVLDSRQGLRVRLDAAGTASVSRERGDAAAGRTAAAPTVERRVAQVEGGYRVDYVIGNDGVDERGIPGVRIASVDGLLMETDQFGRYHVVGIDGGRWERGRNFILKVDPATLPPGSVLTTDNPLVRRITPGLPVRFDFGVKLPPGLVAGGEEAVEMRIGEVLFAPGRDELGADAPAVVQAMAAQVRQRGAGEVVIAADGPGQTLAYERAKALRTALLAELGQPLADALTISLRTDTADPDSRLLSLGARPVLGTVLFDTDQARIRSEFAPVIAQLARDLAAMGGGAVSVIGHADPRGARAYNAALGLRRARAVYEAIAAQLPPQVRARLRVDIDEDPAAPVQGLPRQEDRP